MVCAGVGLQQGKQSNATRGDLGCGSDGDVCGDIHGSAVHVAEGERNGKKTTTGNVCICERDGRERERGKGNLIINSFCDVEIERRGM